MLMITLPNLSQNKDPGQSMFICTVDYGMLQFSSDRRNNFSVPVMQGALAFPYPLHCYLTCMGLIFPDCAVIVKPSYIVTKLS